MARGVNKVILVGNLGKDPEVKYSQDGNAVVNFPLATGMEWKDKATGEKREKAEWHRIVAFRKLGEICGEYLSKGQQVYIEGRLQTRSWEQDGITRYTTEVVADQMIMLGGKGQEKKQEQQNYGPDRSADGFPPSVDDDDIPF